MLRRFPPLLQYLGFLETVLRLAEATAAFDHLWAATSIATPSRITSVASSRRPSARNARPASFNTKGSSVAVRPGTHLVHGGIEESRQHPELGAIGAELEHVELFRAPMDAWK